MNGNLNWHNLTNNKYWTIGFDGFKVGNKTMKTISTSTIVDTGTSYILIPTTDF